MKTLISGFTAFLFLCGFSVPLSAGCDKERPIVTVVFPYEGKMYRQVLLEKSILPQPVYRLPGCGLTLTENHGITLSCALEKPLVGLLYSIYDVPCAGPLGVQWKGVKYDRDTREAILDLAYLPQVRVKIIVDREAEEIISRHGMMLDGDTLYLSQYKYPGKIINLFDNNNNARVEVKKTGENQITVTAIEKDGDIAEVDIVDGVVGGVRHR